MIVQLIDNGSLRPDSWFNLVRLAHVMSGRLERDVEAVSLLHSSKIDPVLLGGEPAKVWERTLVRHLKAGERDFYVQPFFLGPSGAITEYMPERLKILREQWGEIHLRHGPFLFCGDGSDDHLLSAILCDRIREGIRGSGWQRPKVLLVDHGSPRPEVTYVRNYLAGQLSVLLKYEVSAVGAASMERREGELYRFNEPLLEHKLDEPGWNSGEVMIAMLFLSPGRHAGKDGDVDAICQAAVERNPGLRTRMTGLVGTHPWIEQLLLARFNTGLSAGITI